MGSVNGGRLLHRAIQFFPNAGGRAFIARSAANPELIYYGNHPIKRSLSRYLEVGFERNPTSVLAGITPTFGLPVTGWTPLSRSGSKG